MEREILDRVRGFIEAERMAEKGMKVAVALSGGRDSVCLLGILRLLQPELGIELSAVHVDHGLRETAARDRAFCEELCAREGIPLTVRAVDVKARVRETGESIEEAARNLRYGVFASLPADRVALAHHQGDQAETVLMNLLRGSGLRGLGGIRPVRDGRYIRPLLCLSPEEILAFADFYARGRKDIVRVTEAKVADGALAVRFAANGRTVARAELLWTEDGEDVEPKKRLWKSAPVEGADFASGRLRAPVPAAAREVILNLITDTGLITSTPKLGQ